MFKNILKTIPHAHSHGGGGVERDKPAAGFIARLSVALIVSLAVIWFVFEGLLWTATSHVEGEYLEKSDVKHGELRASEEAMMHEYNLVDKEKGLYQIPIDQAIHKLVERGSLDIR